MAADHFLKVNPLAEHNGNIALSSNEIPTVGTGSLYQGQGGRAFVQGGGSSSYYGFNVGESGAEHARGSYAPFILGNNANASSSNMFLKSGGSKKRNISSKRKTKNRRLRYSSRKYIKKGNNKRRANTVRRRMLSKYYKSHKKMQKGGSPQLQSNGDMIVGWGAPNGSSVQTEPNAAYSVGGTVTPATTALANPAQATAYNSAHPVL